MKKLLFSLLVLSLLTFVPVPQAKALTVSTDQQCADPDDSSAEGVGLNGRDEQMFIPTQNRLSNIVLKLYSPDIHGDVGVTLKVMTMDNTILGSATIMPSFGSIPVYKTWTFSPDITLTPGTTYKMYLQAVAGKTLNWYTQAPATCDGRAETHAIQGGIDYDGFDFAYETKGYTYTEPVDPEDETPTTTTTTTTTATPAGQSTGTGAAPATTTSTTIKAPSGLQTEYIAAAGAVKLTWTKSSTTDFDGYKVFRSEQEKTGFREIGKTTKTTLEYMDGVNLTVGKTYYYFVRAYKGSDESASTSTVNITIPTPTSDVVVAAKKRNPILNMVFYNEGDFNDNLFYSIMIGSASILLLLLVWYEIRRAHKGEFLKKAGHFKVVK